MSGTCICEDDTTWQLSLAIRFFEWEKFLKNHSAHGHHIPWDACSVYLPAFG